MYVFVDGGISGFGSASDDTDVEEDEEVEVLEETKLLELPFVLTTPVPPIASFETTEDLNGFAGYEGGPSVGELSLELLVGIDIVPEEVLEDAEKLPLESSLEEELDIDPTDTSGTLLGNREPERAVLPTSIVFTLSPFFPPEQPESTKTDAATDIAPLNMFFMIFPQFLNFISLYILYI